ncbi:MAG: helix-turn-helix transcriptional regulator [Desulfovibrio sp.]|nr:helix-turn-helix transcriptional regulator [Desulfovibrio sp.]
MDIRTQTRQFLAASGWSQARLAEAIGVHVVTLNRYLNHPVQISTSERLRDFFARQERTQLPSGESEQERPDDVQ